MKKIGLVGGISWSSTIDYYKCINEEVNKRLGGLNFAECIIYSVNFHDFQKANAANNWDATYLLLLNAARHLKKAGAEVLLLGANTAHIVADKIMGAIDIPVIDIRIATALAIRTKKLRTVGLLGTVYTMELNFFKEKLSEYGIDPIIPYLKADRDFIQFTLLNELGKGQLLQATKRKYIEIINKLISEGSEGIILGCTEIPLLIKQEDLAVPVFNTVEIHVQAAIHAAFHSN